MNKSDSITNLAEALSKAQGEMQPVKFDAVNPFLKNKYASLGGVIDTSKPVLAKHGLAVSQLVYSEGELIGVETILMHSSGEWIGTSVAMAVGEERGKSSAQVAGSIVTYLRRYALSAILGMYADEDGDGNQPEQAPTSRKKRAVEREREEKSDALTDLPIDQFAIDKPVDEPPMTIEDAFKVETSQGVKYGDMSVVGLERMLSAMWKQLKNNDLSDDAKAEIQHKIKAAQVILDAKNNKEI